MPQTRRQFLSQAKRCGPPLLIGGGLLSGRLVQVAHARSELQEHLLQAAQPLLAAKADRERQQLPAQAGEAIRLFFHERVLRVHGFVEEICSSDFGQRLRQCRTEADQHQLLALEFSRQVASGGEITKLVLTIASQIGTELDRSWHGCCEEITSAWGVPLRHYDASFSAADLVRDTEPIIREGLRQVLAAADDVSDRPMLGHLAAGLGESAMLLLRVRHLGPQLALPAFLIHALYQIFSFVTGLLQHQPADYQRRITSRIS